MVINCSTVQTCPDRFLSGPKGKRERKRGGKKKGARAQVWMDNCTYIDPIVLNYHRTNHFFLIYFYVTRNPYQNVPSQSHSPKAK